MKTLTLALCLAALPALAQQGDPKETEVWEPEPPVVAPGKDGGAPSDALILFDGHGLDAWEMTDTPGTAAKWTVADGVLTVKKGSGNIQTRRKFTDFQLHLEWRIPAGITGEGQSRGNSGVFLASTGPGHAGYEIQILDCWNNRTYVNGQAASLYKQSAPLVNACRKPGDWQSYDIIWTAPRFAGDGSLASPARVTLLHNGVLVQNAAEVKGETVYIGKPFYKAHGPAPIKLQDHPDPSAPIGFRNIWVRELGRPNSFGP